MVAVVLDLDTLGIGMPGIGPKFGGALAEAAVVCLQNQAHSCGVGMVVDGDFSRQFTIQWNPLLEWIRVHCQKGSATTKSLSSDAALHHEHIGDALERHIKDAVGHDARARRTPADSADGVERKRA